MIDDEHTIENRLKDFRKRNKLSQEELADELGVSRQSVIALEQGRSMPSLPLAVSICRFFNAAFEDVFEFEREVSEFHKEFSNRIREDNSNLIQINSATAEGKESSMVELEPWRPFREAVTLRDAIDRLFEDSVITPGKSGIVMPKVDIKDRKDRVMVKAELPGVNEEDISVEILDNVMTISGEKREEKEEKDEDKGYYYKESHTGAFSRSFTLPADVLGGKAEADMKNGVLTVTVPKIAPKQASKIKVTKK